MLVHLRKKYVSSYNGNRNIYISVFRGPISFKTIPEVITNQTNVVKGYHF